MSYILEAIKKAERERGGSLLPNTPVNENLQEEESSKRISWVAIAIFVNAAVLLAWLIIQQVNKEELTSSEVNHSNEAISSNESAKDIQTDEIEQHVVVDDHQGDSGEEQNKPEFLTVTDEESEIKHDDVSVAESTEQPVVINNQVPSFFASPDEDDDAVNATQQLEVVTDDGDSSKDIAKLDDSNTFEESGQGILENSAKKFDPPVALVEPLSIKDDENESEYIPDDISEDEFEPEVNQNSVAIALVENRNVPELGELPFSLQQEIPKIRISVHVYNVEKAARKVRINGGLFLEGQSVETGLVVEEITAHGVIFDYEGTLFKISLR